MRLNVEFAKQLNEQDHFEMLGKIVDSLAMASLRVDTVHTKFKGTAEARQELSLELAKMEIYKEIVRLKLSIMDGEWDSKLSEALEIIKKDYVVEKEDFTSMDF